MTLDAKQTLVARYVAQAGWSAIRSLVEKLDEDTLEDYYWLWDDGDDEDEE